VACYIRTARRRTRAGAEGFRAGKYEVLVATDIGRSRVGYHNVSHVITYDVPQHPEDYIHRSAARGRAEQTG